ncbi:hypothetical protein EWM64_g2761 [Hericium alpestre]|uniref:Uncharacterized protein n=1 Tax=Hericium alpestre TaxID=135208 RepID=A0A4Z0A4S5_9AGAM|nr:hypothetical protein EWM64_g2761 [Hericium alpestre]
MTTATPNGQYQSTVPTGYSYPLQVAGSTYYSQMIVSSQSYQNYNTNPNSMQSYQQTGVPYRSAPTEWPQQSYYDPSVQTSLGLGSTHQHAAAAVSTSSSQLAASAKPASSETRTKASMPAVSTSRLRKGVIPDMKSKMNRFRAADMASTVPVESPLTYQPKPSAAGEKRKERSPTPDSIRAGAPGERGKEKGSGESESSNARDKLNSDIAKLAGKLPSHLLAPRNMSSKENIVQAAKLIDEQRAEINRLTDDNAQLKASRDTYQQQAIRLGAENWELQMENQALSYEKSQQQYIINENERRIRELERAQTW